MPRILLALLALAASLHVLAADGGATPHVTASLVAADSTLRPGDTTTVALRIEHEDGWHTYWKNPGDSGMPTRIAWTLPGGVTAGPTLWPVPERIDVGPLTNYGYEGDLLLPVKLSVPADWPAGQTVRIVARAEWLVCKEICLPGGTSLELELPTAAGMATPHPEWGPRLRELLRAIPAPLTGWQVRAEVTERHIVLDLRPDAGSAPQLDRLAFFPDQPDVIDNPSIQTVEKTADGYRLLLMAAPAFDGRLDTLSGLLVASPGLGDGVRAAEVAAPYPGGAPAQRAAPAGATMTADDIRAATASGPSLGFLAALAFAFVGGLVLNLMPCVFPVVSIKVLGFVDQAHGDRRDLRNHGLAFAAGIILCFWAVAGVLLALRAGGAALGWGYQLQSPAIVAGLAALFFLLGLNLSGWFELGTRVQTLAGNVREHHGLGGAFLSGMLATIVATPCTAPFMGAALGFALTQPPVVSMAVFTALALGMGLPYLLLSVFPGLTRWLPRPGRWMETLKQFLAFPLYLTVVWLVWVLGEQQGPGASARLLAGLVLVAGAIWAWKRLSERGPLLGGVVSAVFLACAVYFGWPASHGDALPGNRNAAVWAPYSDDAVKAARATGPVFVDFTAAWCVTCQVNKRVVLQSDEVDRAFADRSFTRFRADWTNRDEHISQALARLGRSGVPVYVVYPAGGGAPELLPELLTRDIVLAAIDRASAASR